MRKPRIPACLRCKTIWWLSVIVSLVTLFSIVSVVGNTSFVHASLLPTQASAQQATDMQKGQQFPVWTNKILHWTQEVFTSTAKSLDPENGQVLTGDIWVQTGNDGLPVSIHVRYTRSDGTLVQEIVQTPDSETDFFGTTYGSQRCTVTPHMMSLQQLRSALPSFVDKTSLSGNGYQQIQTHSFSAFPRTTLLSGVQPMQIYASTSVVQSWQASTTYASRMSDVKTLDLDGQNRILRTEVRLFDGQGTLLQDNWHVYGSLQIYDPATVPTAVFSLNSQVQGVCHA